MNELNKIYNEECIEGMKKIPDLAIETGVMSVPTIVVDNDGELTPHVGQQACLQFINE